MEIGLYIVSIWPQRQGRTGRSGRSSECPKSRSHEVEGTLISEYGELRSVYINELTYKLWIYQESTAMFKISPNPSMLSKIHEPI